MVVLQSKQFPEPYGSRHINNHRSVRVLKLGLVKVLRSRLTKG